MTRLKKLVLNNPVVLKLSEPQLPDSSQLTQYVIKLEEEEKFVLIYALFKLELIRGKSLMFVSSVDRWIEFRQFYLDMPVSQVLQDEALP